MMSLKPSKIPLESRRSFKAAREKVTEDITKLKIYHEKNNHEITFFQIKDVAERGWNYAEATLEVKKPDGSTERTAYQVPAFAEGHDVVSEEGPDWNRLLHLDFDEVISR